MIEGKYEITRLIGEGGMGAVYEAHHKFIGRKVAVKFLHAQYATNPQAIQRFLQEAQIAGSLGHANICEVTDIGRTEDGAPYMLMPLLKGCSLGEEMNALDGLLPTSRVFDIIYQTLTALQRAHDEGIVHRDLKPDNIFLTHMGDREDFVKILDFGISKIVSGTGSMPGVSGGLTTTGMVLGTPYYMAPEQAKGAKDLDHRVDIYAVGVILYELLTGQTPFQAESYNEIIVKIVMEPFPTPRSINARIPVAVEEVVLKAMARDPGERFKSARDFKHALLTQARESEMSLPSYLTRADFTGDVELFDTRALEGEAFPRKRKVLPIAAGALVAVAAVVLLVLQPWKGESKGETNKSAPPTLASMDAMRAPPKPDRVTLRFLGLPVGGRIVVDGKRVWHGTVKLPRSTQRLRYRATAPGHVASEDWIVPDRDRTTSLQLGTSSAGPPPMGRPGRHHGVRPRHAVRAPGMRAPGMRRTSAMSMGTMRVRGRHDTVIDTDYGED
ncbi:MAG: serine/threonine-protein kinase [bacterium]